MATFNKFNLFVDDLAKGSHALNTNSIKVMLTGTAPAAANHIKADITEISAANGYSAGGNAVTITLSPSGGIESINSSNSIFTASGGSFGPFQYAVLYNATNNLLIGWVDYGTPISLNAGETFTVAPAGGTWFTIT